MKVLANVRQIVKPSWLVIEVPNSAADGFSKLGPVWPWADEPRHIHFFSERALGGLPASRGFSLERTYYTGFNRNLDERWLQMQRRIGAIPEPNWKFDFEGRS